MTISGEVYSFGAGSYFRLGHGIHSRACYILFYSLKTIGFKNSQDAFTFKNVGSDDDIAIPCKVDSLDGIKIATCSCGTWHTAVVAQESR